jgi:hypothetical protein
VVLRRLRRGAITAAAAACGALLATTIAAAASTNVSVSPRDNCGGFNGHVVWSAGSSPYIQVYGEVWQNQCSSGSTSVWLSWDSAGYHNVEAQSAGASQTQGVNYKTATSVGAENMKVTVCSQYGGWHCGDPVAVPAGSPSTTGTATSPPPVVTAPVAVPVPEPPVRRQALRVKLTLSWTWDHAITHLRSVKIGSFPRATRLLVRCLGHGCPRPATAVATGSRGVRRLLRSFRGRRYWAGDRLLISLRAPGWTPERAQIRIRSGKVPKAGLLPS